ncbi:MULTISPECIES: hypothetical protein [unclassified Campylobacter]|uniref:hypothetical protein n=1 Tax=unclassified Campylobacter TaxID=2593542 RepID=UPI003D33557B
MRNFFKLFILIFVSFCLNGCLFLNERGISTRYYNDCKEYYDAAGNYQKDCPHNVIDWK